MSGLRGIVVIAVEAEDIWEAPPKENWAFFMSGFSKKVVFVLGDLGDLAGMVVEKLPKRDGVPVDDIVSVVSSRMGWKRVKQSYCNKKNWCKLDVFVV